MATNGKRASSAKPKTTKAAANSKPKRPVTGGDMDRRWAILLFGLGLLFFVLSVVPGESAWAWIRANLLFGTFGVSGWLLGPMLVWWAVLVSLEKPVLGPIIKSVVFLFVLSGVVLVFSPIDFEGLTFGEVLAALLESGRSGPFGGGLISLVFGASLLALTGRVAARILIILLLLITVMVLTGLTPGDIARFFSRLGDKIADRMDRAYEEEPAPETARDAGPAHIPAQAAQDVPASPALASAPAARGGSMPQAALSAPPRKMSVVDIGLTAPPEHPLGNGGGSQGARRRSAVDIDLGPEGPASTPGLHPNEPVEIGPGGTFGMNPLDEAPGHAGTETGLGDDYEPLIPFRPTPAAVPEEPPADGNILLFGEHDPYANLGGAESRLPPGTALDVEYVPPPDHNFDLFGAGPGAGTASSVVPVVPSANMPVAPLPDAPVPVMPPTPANQPASPFASPAKTRNTVWDPAGAAGAPFDLSEDSAWERGKAREQGPLETPPSTLLQSAGVSQPQNAAGGPGEPSVDELIDKATPKGEHAAAADTRELQDVVAPYRYPPIDAFDRPPPETTAGAKEEMKRTADLLVSTLGSFGVDTRILYISRGPSVTRYEVQPQAGVKISRITNLSDDIALNLAAAGVRIEAPIPGKPAVGIEVPNKVKSTVSIRGILESTTFAAATSPLSIALGKDIAGENVVADLTKMPHLLIAGSTGSGKSVCVNSIIMSFLYKSAPEDVKMILIDPKVVELAEYNGIPHLLIPVVTEPKMAAKALGQAVVEMENRYHLFAEYGVRDINTFNKLAKRDGAIEKMPHIAIIIDELADLMMTAGKDVENYICRIAQKARAAGMHLIVATQRPSVDVITGLIKSNIPSRIAFAVSSQVDSRTILDGAGAEKLLGMGDMLFMPIGANKPVRVQGTYVKDKEISAVLRFVKAGSGAFYDDAFLSEMDKVQLSGAAKGGDATDDEESGDLIHDPVFQSAVETVLEAGQASTSYLQRRLRLGYARAGRIMDQMERMGIVSEPDGSKPRKLLISRQQWQEMIMNATE